VSNLRGEAANWKQGTMIRIPKAGKQKKINMKPDFSKYTDGLVPTIVQDAVSSKVLMLGFMNEAALSKTNSEGKVTFFSRTKQRLWTKGATIFY